ncbi:MAG: hypothetical protein HQL21_08125, partial [Candidatus Omnitrophica bacterium]|nr:hypothetical protein [Candidatus Omnitrophota bacterium]
ADDRNLKSEVEASVGGVDFLLRLGYSKKDVGAIVLFIRGIQGLKDRARKDGALKISDEQYEKDRLAASYDDIALDVERFIGSVPSEPAMKAEENSYEKEVSDGFEDAIKDPRNELVYFVTKDANYIFHSADHKKHSFIPEAVLERADAIILERVSFSRQVNKEKIRSGSVRDFLQDNQQGDLVKYFIEHQKAVFVNDAEWRAPWYDNDQLRRNTLLPMGLPLALAQILLHKATGLDLEAVDKKYSTFLGLFLVLSPMGGYRSSLASRKLVRGIVPYQARRMGRKPTILLEFGGWHIDMKAYITKPFLREVVLLMNRPLGAVFFKQKKSNEYYEVDFPGGVIRKFKPSQNSQPMAEYLLGDGMDQAAAHDRDTLGIPGQAEQAMTAGESVSGLAESFQSLRALSNENLPKRGVHWVLTNEQGWKPFLNEFPKPALGLNARSLHIGVGGIQNLDMIVHRSPALALIVDVDPFIKEFYEDLSRILLENEDVWGDELFKRLGQAGYDLSGSTRPDLPEQELSWLRDKEKCDLIRTMFREGRILVIQGSMRDKALFSAVASWVKENDVKVDTLYASNVAYWEGPALDSIDRIVVEALSQVVDWDTFLIHSQWAGNDLNVHGERLGDKDSLGLLRTSLLPREVAMTAKVLVSSESPVTREIGRMIREAQAEMESPEQEIRDKAKVLISIYPHLVPLAQGLVRAYASLARTFDLDPGKVQLRMVGGRVRGKPLKGTTDIDFIFSVEYPKTALSSVNARKLGGTVAEMDRKLSGFLRKEIAALGLPIIVPGERIPQDIDRGKMIKLDILNWAQRLSPEGYPVFEPTEGSLLLAEFDPSFSLISSLGKENAAEPAMISFDLKADPADSIFLKEGKDRSERTFVLGDFTVRGKDVKDAKDDVKMRIHAQEIFDPKINSYDVVLKYFPAAEESPAVDWKEPAFSSVGISLREGVWLINDFYPFSQDEEMIRRLSGFGATDMIMAYLVGLVNRRGGNLRSSESGSLTAALSFIRQGLKEGALWPTTVVVDGDFIEQEKKWALNKKLMEEFFDKDRLGEVSVAVGRSTEASCFWELKALGKGRYRVEAVAKRGRLVVKEGDVLTIDVSGSVFKGQGRIGRIVDASNPVWVEGMVGANKKGRSDREKAMAVKGFLEPFEVAGRQFVLIPDRTEEGPVFFVVNTSSRQRAGEVWYLPDLHHFGSIKLPDATTPGITEALIRHLLKHSGGVLDVHDIVNPRIVHILKKIAAADGASLSFKTKRGVVLDPDNFKDYYLISRAESFSPEVKNTLAEVEVRDGKVFLSSVSSVLDGRPISSSDFIIEGKELRISPSRAHEFELLYNRKDVEFNAHLEVSGRELAMKGGIDLRTEQMDLKTTGSGEGIEFKIDPAMLERLQDTKGFVPVIMNIEPLKSLPEFLGVKMDGAPVLEKQACLSEKSPEAREHRITIVASFRRRFIA